MMKFVNGEPETRGSTPSSHPSLPPPALPDETKQKLQTTAKNKKQKEEEEGERVSRDAIALNKLR